MCQVRTPRKDQILDKFVKLQADKGSLALYVLQGKNSENRASCQFHKSEVKCNIQMKRRKAQTAANNTTGRQHKNTNNSTGKTHHPYINPGVSEQLNVPTTTVSKVALYTLVILFWISLMVYTDIFKKITLFSGRNT